MFVTRDQICSHCVQRSKGIYSYLPGNLKETADCFFDPSALAKGRTIYREGDSLQKVFLINAGMVKVIKNHSGTRAQIVNLLGPGDFMGTECLGQDRYGHSAVAISTVELCACTSGDFARFLERYPEAALGVIDRMHRHMARMQRILFDVGTKMALARVASCLLFLGEKATGAKGAESFTLPITRQDMSALVGISPETLSRQLKKLIDGGVVDISGRQVKIVDAEALHRISQG